MGNAGLHASALVALLMLAGGAEAWVTVPGSGLTGHLSCGATGLARARATRPRPTVCAGTKSTSGETSRSEKPLDRRALLASSLIAFPLSLLPALALSKLEGDKAPPDIAVLEIGVDAIDGFQEQRGIESWVEFEKGLGKFSTKYDSFPLQTRLRV